MQFQTDDSNISSHEKKTTEISDCVYTAVKVSTNNGNNKNNKGNEREKAPQVLRTADIS